MATVEIARLGPGYGFDVISGQVVNMTEAGIWDVAAVQKMAVSQAIKGAALALTIDTLVHRKNPIEALKPD